MRFPLLFTALASGLLLNSCVPDSTSKTTAQLQERVKRLEEQLQENELQLTETEVAARETVALIRDRVQQLERSAAEGTSASGGVQEAIARQLELTQAQLMEFQGAINSLLELTHTGQNWIRFGLGYAGHAVARTPHGSFLVELRSQEPAKDGKGHVVKLRIGNSTSLTIHKFKLSGHFGAPPPEPKAGTAPAPETQREWESRLRPFEQSFTTVLPNASWKEVDLLLPAERLADLRFIRMRMEVERASLPEATESGPERLRIGLESKGGFILHTDHGSIIMALEGHRKTADGHELQVRFGNPLGLTVTRCTLQGRHGPEPPKIEAFSDFEKYRFALSEWQQRVRPFELDVPGELLPFTWNPKTLKFPTKDPAELAFIECRLLVKNVSLRQP
jgi:hypothetical protein